MSLDATWREVGGLAIALGLLLLVGRAVLSLGARGLAGEWPERLALSFLVGAGTISLLGFWLSPLFGLVPAQWLLSLVAVGLAVVAWRRRRTVPHTSSSASTAPLDTAERRWLTKVLTAGIALQAAALLFVAMQTSLGWDGLLNMELKAHLAFVNEPSGQLPPGYLSDESRVWSHPGYPLLVPLTEVWLYDWIGRPHQGLIKLLFPIFYLSLAGLFYGALRRVMLRTPALVGCAALGLLPMLAIGPGAAITGYADVPLAAVLFGAVSYGFFALRGGDRTDVALAVLLASLALWTKREGAVLAAYVVLALAGARAAGALHRGQTPFDAARRGLALLVVPALVAVPWTLMQRLHGLPDPDLSPVTVGTLAANVSRFPAILQLLARELTLPGHWAALWPAFAFTLVLSWRRLREPAELFLAGAVVVPLAVYATIFVFSSWPEYTEHVGTALPRLVIPLAPLALFATIRHLRASLMPLDVRG